MRLHLSTAQSETARPANRAVVTGEVQVVWTRRARVDLTVSGLFSSAAVPRDTRWVAGNRMDAVAEGSFERQS
jgi:hypothetical protein